MQLPLAQIIPTSAAPLSVHTIDSTRSIIVSACSSTATASVHALASLEKLRVPLELSSQEVPFPDFIHPLATTSLLFLVRGDTVTVWNDAAQEMVFEIKFKEEVLGLTSRRDRLVIALRRRIVVFCIHTDCEDRSGLLTKECEYETVDNAHGLVSIATTPGSTLMAFPGRQAGHVQVVRLPPLLPSNQITSHTSHTSSGSHPSIHIFVAHTSPLRTLTLSETGALLTTSSTKGTLLRVYSTASKNLVRELRRGTDQAVIWSVAYAHPDKGEIIACSSDKGTVHIWHVGDVTSSAGSSATRERKISGSEIKDKPFNLFKPYLPAYFSSQWSDLTWRIPTATSIATSKSSAIIAAQDDVALCVFPAHGGTRNDVLVITRSGCWYRLSTSSTSAETDSEQAQAQSAALLDRKGKATTHETDKKATLLAFKRFGQLPDGEEDWSGDED